MAKSRFAQTRVYDTSGVGIAPNDASASYTEAEVPVSDTSKKPKGIGERDKRRHNQKAQLHTGDMASRDSFDMPRISSDN